MSIFLLIFVIEIDCRTKLFEHMKTLRLSHRSETAKIRQNSVIRIADTGNSGIEKQDRIMADFSRVARSNEPFNSTVDQCKAKADRMRVEVKASTERFIPGAIEMELSPLTLALTAKRKAPKKSEKVSEEKLSTVKIESMPNRGLKPEVKATVKIARAKNTFVAKRRELDIPESVIMACIRRAAEKFKSNPSPEMDAMLTFLRSNSAKLVTELRKELKSGKELRDEVVGWIC